MEPIGKLSRRTFMATAGASAAASQLTSTAVASTTEASKLAIHGGAKSVVETVPAYPRWGAPERAQLNATIDQTTLFYWQGPQTKLLTDRFRTVCPLKYVMTCSSGTAALHIAVAAAGIAPGDEVITSPITDIGTVIGTIYQQAVPVFADLLPNSYTLDPADVERKITPKTRAIIAVHLGGNPSRMAELRALADQHQLTLIEDCAQAWGARYRGQPIGTLGHVACFSLQQTKQITCGDGGVVATNDDRFGPLLQSYGDKGGDRIRGRGVFERFATNYRMSELQAAVAAAQLDRLEDVAAKRSRLGNALGAAIAGLPGIEPHDVADDDRSTYWFYFFRLTPNALRCNRAEFVKAMVAEGVQGSAGYIPMPMYANPVFRQHGFFAGRWPIKEAGLTSMDYANVSCPEAEAILTSGVRVAIHEAMSDAYVAQAGEAIAKVARHFAA